MIAAITFSIIAAGLVFLAGRKDSARDPRLTVLMLVLSAAFPMMAAMLPKINLLVMTGEAAGESGFPWGEILFSIWALGFAIVLGRLLIAARGLQRWRKHAVAVDRVDGIVICELENLRGPVAAGIFKRVIFVPVSWCEWPEANRRVVLEHELAHHRRRDPLWRLCVELACAVHWYHPLVRWMARRFIVQCEFACDAIVLRKGIDAKTYAQVLCDFAEDRTLSPLVFSLAESSALETRVCRMLTPASCFSGKAFLVLGGLGFLAACSLAMIGRQNVRVPSAEVQLRLTADPFPGNQ